MKKIFIALFMLFAITNVCAGTDDSNVRRNYNGNTYYYYTMYNKSYKKQFGYIYANDKIAYSLNLESDIFKNLYSSSEYNNNSDIPLIIYFGYGYIGNTLEDYIATQQLIWDYQNTDVVFKNNAGVVIDVSEKKNKIMEYVNKYKMYPAFSNLEFELGSTNLIKDDNNILDGFDVISNSTDFIEKNNNTLSIKSNSIGTKSFTLKEEYEEKWDNILYTANSAQTMVQVGKIENKIKDYLYEVSGGVVTINLYDKNTNSKENSGLSTFKGNTFNLYNSSNILIDSYDSNELGIISINNLEIGKYKLEHVLASNGYEKEKNIYEFEIDLNNTKDNIDIYLKPVVTTLNINKTYGNPKLKTLFYDNNVVFVITNSKGEEQKCITDKFGFCSINLVYDKYTVKQITTNNINKLEDNYIIDNKSFKNPINYNIYTPLYKSKIRVCLYESGTTIPIENTVFKISDTNYTTNKEGMFVTEYFEVGNYVLKEFVKDGYFNTDNITIVIDKDSNFYLKDDEVFIDIIIYNEKLLQNKQEVITDKIIVDDLTVEEKTNDRLPNLGRYDANILYMILFVLKRRNVKKNIV